MKESYYLFTSTQPKSGNLKSDITDMVIWVFVEKSCEAQLAVTPSGQIQTFAPSGLELGRFFAEDLDRDGSSAVKKGTLLAFLYCVLSPKPAFIPNDLPLLLPLPILFRCSTQYKLYLPN
ncbi:unnamed protein product [Rodentolepis nana]|uniref:EH domain-containing protein n=1 Tax=Rodentolepis nana TaxID=102285 RepID=A0A0R3TI39_RODNA|nr:unnamed protein product [Rodentolepis nana]